MVILHLSDYKNFNLSEIDDKGTSGKFLTEKVLRDFSWKFHEKEPIKEQGTEHTRSDTS